VSRDVIWQPGHMAEESITVTADGLGDGWETSGRGDHVIVDKLVPFDLQQLSLALHMESLEGSGVDGEECLNFNLAKLKAPAGPRKWHWSLKVLDKSFNLVVAFEKLSKCWGFFLPCYCEVITFYIFLYCLVS